ncbi:AAA family ATPase, partial [Brucella intermedia]|uniref:AAA family ATPase n=2 Tax=Brucella/Ochrobactrum group TaxID=2826938 RepID=UPI002B057C86
RAWNVIEASRSRNTMFRLGVRMLIILGGLPASGKSTIAQALAVRIGACYLRVDTVEQAIRSAAPPSAGNEVGPAGWLQKTFSWAVPS